MSEFTKTKLSYPNWLKGKVTVSITGLHYLEFLERDVDYYDTDDRPVWGIRPNSEQLLNPQNVNFTHNISRIRQIATKLTKHTFL